MEKFENNIKFHIDSFEIEKRKERIRSIWQYKKVDHVPLELYVIDNREGFTRKEIETEKEKNLRFDLNNVKKSLQLIPDDYIPFLKPEVGCTTIPSILGAEVYYTESFDNFSTVKEPLIRKIEELKGFEIPFGKRQIKKKGMMPLNIEKIRYYRNQTKDLIDYCGFDIGGVMCGSVDILESSLFYISLLTEKEKMIHFLSRLSELYVNVQDILISEYGGVENLFNVDWETSWYPEGRKGYVSDDPCANFNSEIFEIFSKPFNQKIYDVYGYGGFHNCGPHPCAGTYVDYGSQKLGAINCSLKCTYQELEKFISTFQGKGVVLYFLFEEEYYDARQAVSLYSELAEIGTIYQTPCIPLYPIDHAIYSESEIQGIFKEFLKISCEYAKSLDLK